MGLAGAGQVGGLLEARGDREQRAGLLGEQAGQRPVERDERGRGVQQRAGGVLERGRALREQPLDGSLARERRPRGPGSLGGQLLVESDDAPRRRVRGRSSNRGAPASAGATRRSYRGRHERSDWDDWNRHATRIGRISTATLLLLRSRLRRRHLPCRFHWQLEHLAQCVQVPIPWPNTIRLPEVYARRADANLFSNFDHR